MTDASIDDNQALIGGGVFSAIATWILPEASSLTRVTVSNNHGRWGGGITNALGTMNLVNATVSGNTTASDMNAPHTGGGLLNLSRLHGVRFKDDGGQWSWGGDLDSLDTTLRLFNVTVTDNASDRFGGIDNQDHLVIANSVVGDNHDWLGVDEPDCGTDPTFVMAHPNVPVYTSQGYSLLGNVNNKECGRLMDTDRIGTKGSVLGPRLMPLAHSGGFAQTHLLKVGSPLIDAANPGGCFDPEGHDLVEDQRGESRPFAFKGGEARCDVGAVELH